MGAFASDQHKPSVRYEESEQGGDGLSNPGPGANHPSATSGSKVMELEKDLAIEPDPLVDWRMLYLNYLLRDTLPTNRTEARWLAHHAKSFVLVEGELYKRSHTRILQRCIPFEQGKRLLSDIHGGVYGHHATPRTLVGNVFQQGFYCLPR
ncbi:uncharacterized protein [Miscanthus floridulus]|uniref:uncharacterized protein n=1 Tax=Miscanthus floridulus TaxID=154761 RepID=UPI0034595BDD